MMFNPIAPPSGILLVGSMIVEDKMLHYVICQSFLPHVSNVAQESEEDILLMWIIMTSKKNNWVHMIRHRMKKALREGLLYHIQFWSPISSNIFKFH